MNIVYILEDMADVLDTLVHIEESHLPPFTTTPLKDKMNKVRESISNAVEAETLRTAKNYGTLEEVE